MRSARSAVFVAACVSGFCWAAAAPAGAEAANAEIESLLVAVGQSGCGFVRNGKAHGSAEAEEHLRLKYRNGARYADTPEHFIDRLGSKSSWTGQPYRVRCPGEPEQPASEWLHGLLRAQREAAGAAAETR